MKILFEEYAYESVLLEKILPKGYYHQFTPTLSKIPYVGYFNSSPLSVRGETIIILPKIFLLQNEKLFGLYMPEDLLNEHDIIWDHLKEDGKSDILYNFSVWIFRAIQNFVKRSPNSLSTDTNQINQIINNTGNVDHTELGLVLSLFKFYKDNKLLFTQVSKLRNSGKNNINWNKTTSRTNPVIQHDNIFYPEYISKSKSINFDEELLIIFYSILNYYKVVYNFQVNLESNYTLYKARRFEKLLESGTRILRSIKYKYFNDRFVRLWNLLYTFFEKAESSRSNKQFEEILLVKDFNLVFEDMVDDLLSDKILPKNFKNNKDGKELDHIYKDVSLLGGDFIYFIGDSKYYKPSSIPGVTSVAKQFTYAKNIIQYNIDLFNSGQAPTGIKYRDDLTEGYNITPNFFIQGIIDEEFDFGRPLLNAQIGRFNFSYHFKNRLFDRDSLFLQHYNINFLFVVSSYVSNNFSAKQRFKVQARKLFRENLIIYFNSKYRFVKITPSLRINDFVDKYFRRFIGKMYRPENFDNNIIIAFDLEDDQDGFDIIGEGDIQSWEPFTLV